MWWMWGKNCTEPCTLYGTVYRTMYGTLRGFLLGGVKITMHVNCGPVLECHCAQLMVGGQVQVILAEHGNYCAQLMASGGVQVILAVYGTTVHG